MNVGYFTFANIRIAETFIYDLIQGLEKKSDLTWFSGQKSIDEKVAKHQVSAGFSPYESRFPNWVFKIGQLKGGTGYRWRMKLRLALAKKALADFPEDRLPDVGYTEFLTTAILLREFFEEKGIPYVVHVHAYDITSELNDPEYKKEIQKVFCSASSIIAPSEYIKKLLILEGCPSEKVHVVRLGIDTDSIIPMSWEERLINVPSIVFLGRLVEKKSPIALIYAFEIVKKKIPDAKLTIIGQGNLQQEIEECIHSLGLEDSVTLTGALSRDESFPIMNQHWIYVQHSITTLNGDREGAPVSISEASAHALPVVSTIHSGIPEQVIDGKTGFLVQECDYEEMGERIIDLIENPELTEKMGKAGREHIKELNDPQKRIDAVYDLLEKASS
ncbi:MAG: glycosyltransferase family 4 protein [Campylobacterota bacterium]|nr:glycosyltransferase family 4 protein [Campylobacterota bacterium]